MANCKNVECRGLPGNGRSEQESCCMMPAVFPVKTGSVAAHFSADLKRQVQLVKTFGACSQKSSFLPSGGTTSPLNRSHQFEHLSRDAQITDAPHTAPLHSPVWPQRAACPAESDFCFVEASDGVDGGRSWAPASSGGSIKSNFVNKVVGAFRNMSQRSTTWINPDYLVDPALKSAQLSPHLLPPQLQRKNFNSMQFQKAPECEPDCYLQPCPHVIGGDNCRPACSRANIFKSFGSTAQRGAWQNGDVLGSQSDELLYQNLSREQFLLHQQQQYLYYQNLQDKKLLSAISDSNYGSDIDDSWNVVSARDCVETNYNNNVNDNTAPPGVTDGLVQLTVPSISCMNITMASQLFNSAFCQSIPNASFSTLCSPANKEFCKFQTQDNFETAIHEFSFAEAPEVPVNDACVSSRNFSLNFAHLTTQPETSKLTAAAAGGAQDLVLSQTNNLPLVESSLNPNAKEWNGWVSCSKLNPEAKEWIPTAMENVQSEVSNHQLDPVHHGGVKRGDGKKQFCKESSGITAQLRINSVDSKLANSAEYAINIDTMSEESIESNYPILSPVASEELPNSSYCTQERLLVHETDLYALEAPSDMSIYEKPSENLGAASESATWSWDEVDTRDPTKLNESKLPELYMSCDIVKFNSSDETVLRSAENVPSYQRSEDVTERALSKKSSCLLFEKFRNFSFSPCKMKSNSVDEPDDVCEFVIFSEENDDDFIDNVENYTVADDDCDDTDVSDSDSDSENEDSICVTSAESSNKYNIKSYGGAPVQMTPSSPEPSQTDCCSLTTSTSLSSFWHGLKLQQQRQHLACADLSDDDWDWHSESNSGSISASCWAFEQGLMTLKTPINTLSKRLGYVEKERKKSLTEVEKANLKWDTEIDNNVLGNSGQKVMFDDVVSFCYVEKNIERKGEWEQIARDNGRFRNKIHNLSAILSPVLEKDHRNDVYQARFQHSLEDEISAGDR